ncbi:MAG: THUMP domain-containing protein [Thermoplasmataceae archaeon]
MFIIRYSELGLKGPKARSQMEKRLIANLSEKIRRRNLEAEIRKESGRIFLYTRSNPDDVSECISTIFGVKSYSEAEETDFNTLNDIIMHAQEKFRGTVSGKKFVVRAKRFGNHPFTSMDVEREVGDALFQYSCGVSIRNPDVRVFIEIRNKKVYYFDSIKYGPGGLPLGSQGKVTALMSGGIDSPVSTWMIMKRGCPADIIFVSLAHPVDTIQFTDQMSRFCDRWCNGYDPYIHIIDGSLIVQSLNDKQLFTYPNISFKKILYRLAEKICSNSGSYGIVTGESIGQVSSQTVENLYSLSVSIKVPVLRPLLGMDKDEITVRCRDIGALPSESLGEFCSIFARHPITRIKPEQLDHDVVSDQMVNSIISTETVIRGSEIKQYHDRLVSDHSAGTVIESPDFIIDLRNKEDYNKWHYPGAISLDFSELASFSSENPGKKYILYCGKGLQSAAGAVMLSKLGNEAMFASTEYMKRLEHRKDHLNSS